MGFFSWKTSDTNKSISNIYSSRGTFPVYLLLPDDSFIEEPEYQGYGIFGGEDVYALVARWNARERCTGDPREDRSVGIELACRDEDNAALGYPIKIVEHPVPYEDALPSESCEYQGFFYDDEMLDLGDADDSDWEEAERSKE